MCLQCAAELSNRTFMRQGSKPNIYNPILMSEVSIGESNIDFNTEILLIFSNDSNL